MSGEVPWTDEVVTVDDGARIRCRVTGAQTGAAAVVLLHGGLGAGSDFGPVLPSLVERWRVVTLDSRGHGASTLGTAGLTYERLERDVEQVVARLGLGHVRLVGFSDGGIVALRLAAGGRVDVAKVVAIGTDWTLPPEPTRQFLSRLTADGWRSRFPQSVADYEAQNPEPDLGRLVERVKAMWLDAGPAGYPGDAMTRRVTAPTLVIRGDDDRLVSRQTALDLAERVTGAKLLNLPFAGHAAHADQPELVGRMMERFLGE